MKKQNREQTIKDLKERIAINETFFIENLKKENKAAANSAQRRIGELTRKLNRAFKK